MHHGGITDFVSNVNFHFNGYEPSKVQIMANPLLAAPHLSISLLNQTFAPLVLIGCRMHEMAPAPGAVTLVWPCPGILLLSGSQIGFSQTFTYNEASVTR